MQGRGFGRRLLSLAQEIAAEEGFPALRLYTNALMVENIRLYETLGYRHEREELRDVGTVVYMRKRLPA
jgi:ribosomal protein S18 acetylase RimI-like enzyme